MHRGVCATFCAVGELVCSTIPNPYVAGIVGVAILTGG